MFRVPASMLLLFVRKTSTRVTLSLAPVVHVRCVSVGFPNVVNYKDTHLWGLGANVEIKYVVLTYLF